MIVTEHTDKLELCETSEARESLIFQGADSAAWSRA